MPAKTAADQVFNFSRLIVRLVRYSRNNQSTAKLFMAFTYRQSGCPFVSCEEYVHITDNLTRGLIHLKGCHQAPSDK